MPVIINEVHYDPDATIAGDANGDGVRDANQDEFIEIVNTGPGSVNISGWTLSDDDGDDFTFPPGTILADGQAAVLFGGGTPTGGFGGALVFTDDGSIGTGLSNTGDVVELRDDMANLIDSLDYTPFSNDPNESLTRDPDLTGSFVEHAGATGASGALFSPGTQIDGSAFCFAAGTLIANEQGETKVEELRIDDQILTADGRTVAVKWIGRQTLAKRFFKERAQLVRIASGALGNHSDLYVTGDHGMVAEGYVINAAALINGTTVTRVSLADTPERQTVYHIETEAHDVILANGTASETYLDMPGRAAFDNFDEYLDLYGTERNITENPLPRIVSARLLPASLKARLVA